MDTKSQFYPPHTEHSAELYAYIEKNAALLTSPERQRGPFKFIEQNATLIDSFRDTAVAIEQQNGRQTRLAFTPIVMHSPARHPKIIHEDLIKKELLLAGKIFGENYAFWLGDKADSPAATKDAHDWYIAPFDGYKVNEAAMIHVASSPNYLLKYNAAGQSMPMTIQDIERFVPAVYHYVHQVLPLYPFERDRAEVLLDGMEIPDDVAVLLPPKHDDGRKNDYDLAA